MENLEDRSVQKGEEKGLEKTGKQKIKPILEDRKTKSKRQKAEEKGHRYKCRKPEDRKRKIQI